MRNTAAWITVVASICDDPLPPLDSGFKLASCLACRTVNRFPVRERQIATCGRCGCAVDSSEGLPTYDTA
jgi:hypothetical protein